MAFSSSVALQPGDEIYLRYGGHSNAALFTEYGFVLALAEKAHTFNGEVLIDCYVEDLLRSRENHTQKCQLLKDRNYWGDWTLHVEDGVGRPSYRLLPVLRLVHISLGPTSGRELELWENTILGLAEVVSAENEHGARASLIEICERITRESEISTPIVKNKMETAQGAEHKGEGYLHALCMALVLWEEAHRVAEFVKKAVVDGIEF
ncbi:RuBisCO LSMT substrate-binding protein [Ceratobasidium sp. AG-Ba]|nr:RuBisCO LSMT substrate-binding protein [Ceratobasidium sp. AG-Ba]